MPLYDYHCKICKHDFEEIAKIDSRNKTTCPTCHKKATLLTTNMKIDWFKPFWHEHMDTRPVYIESKQHFKKLCKEKGVQAPCLM
jgi:putative FmdB family regulatory protein